MKFGNSAKTNLFKIFYLPKENNEEKVRIFGGKFINNNKDKCKIIFNNKKYELKEYFEDIDNNYNHKDLIIFKLIFIHNIINMSYMFAGCNSLISLHNISKLGPLKLSPETNEDNFNYNLKNKTLLNIYSIKDTNISYKIYKQLLLSSTSKFNRYTFNKENENYVFERNKALPYFQLFINNIKGMF